MKQARSHAGTQARSVYGFTLIELLVVIGILAVLISILLPLVIRSRTQAGKIRTQGDFQTIGVALEAYKTDFGDYPRPDAPDTGAAILGKALLGRYGDGLVNSAASPTVDTNDPINYNPVAPYKPGDCVRYSGAMYVMIADPAGTQPAPNDINYWVQFDPRDGADGPGFRSRPGGGKVHGPYIAQGKLNSQGTYLTDHNGGAILYFVARSVQPALTINGTPAPYVDQSGGSLYNADHNFRVFRRLAPSVDADNVVLTRIRIMLGDYNANGYIDNGETPITQNYLLWSPGNDGVFGPAGFTPQTGNSNAVENKRQVGKCDDVMNVQ